MAKSRPIVPQTHLTSYVRGFERAGFPPHRAKVSGKDLILFFSPDVPDGVFDEDAKPEAAFDAWRTKRDAR